MHGVDTRIVRIFNTYGPRMQADDGRVVSNFVLQSLSGIPITIYGDGSQTRSFCYVDDLIDGMIRTMQSTAIGPEPVNLGNPQEITIRELADTVIEMTVVDIADRLPAASDRRPDAAPTGYFAGRPAARLATGDGAAQRLAAHDRLFPGDAGSRCQRDGRRGAR